MPGDCPVDVIFVMDQSGSMSKLATFRMRQFINDIIQGIPTSPTQARIGALKFSDAANTILELGENANDQDAILATIKNCKTIGTFTNTAAGLGLMRDMFNADARGGGVKKIAVVMTDGFANRPSGTAKADLITQANGARADGIIVVSVGRSAENT